MIDCHKIDCHKDSRVGFLSDRLYYSNTVLNLLRKLVRVKKSLSGEVDLPTAKIICQDYINLDRQAFEENYQMFYDW